MPSTSSNPFRRAMKKLRGRPSQPPADLEKLMFLHVPKCGGQSIDMGLRVAYEDKGAAVDHLDSQASAAAADALGEPVHEFRERMLYYFLAGHAHYVSGHFSFSPAAWRTFGQGWQVVTVLREPVARWISNYFFNKYKANDHFRITQPLAEFIDTDRARLYGRSYVTFLNNELTTEQAAEDSAIEGAIATLNRFAVVGLLEKLDIFAADCGRRFDADVNIGHQNQNPRDKSQQQDELTAELRARIVELCEPSTRVYNAAKQRIEERGTWLR